MAPRKEPSFTEFVALVAVMMGVTALGIDNTLPAFVPIREAFGVASQNELQLIVYVYMIGFAVMQLVYGPLSDVVGRRPLLAVGLGVYVAGGLLAILAPNFEVLLAARLIQGMGAAAGRVLAVAIVRDRYSGREMARVMSLTMIVFILVPILAPATGSLILLVSGWRFIFAFIMASAAAILAWFWLRMPETLHPDYRLPFSLRGIVAGMRLTVTARVAIGYSTAMGLLFGCIMAYVGSSQQIFQTDIYALGNLYPVAFGAIAVAISAASIVNAQMVRRIGTRRMSHFGLCGAVAASALLLVSGLASGGHPPLVVFGGLIAAQLFLQSLAFPNFNAMAMEPLGKVAGTAASFIGFYTTLIGAVSGLLIGQAYNGTTIPMSIGFLALSTLAFLIVLWTERGRLFRPTIQGEMQAPVQAQAHAA